MEAGDYVSAMEVTEKALGESEDTQLYMPFGNLFLEMEGPEEITEYHRELDLETAEMSVRYRNFGHLVERRCLISEPDQIMVYQIKSERPFTLCIRAEGGSGHSGLPLSPSAMTHRSINNRSSAHST